MAIFFLKAAIDHVVTTILQARYTQNLQSLSDCAASVLDASDASLTHILRLRAICFKIAIKKKLNVDLHSVK